MKVKSLSLVRLFVTPWTVAHQAPLSMGFSRHEYWSGLPFPSPGGLLNPGIKPRSPALQADALTSEPPGKPRDSISDSSERLLQIGSGGKSIYKILVKGEFTAISQVTNQVTSVSASHKELISPWRDLVLSRCEEMQGFSQSVSSVIQSCLTLCHPMNWSTPGFPVHHQLPELIQTRVHQISDTIQPSHPCHPLLLPPSIFPSIKVFSIESVLHIRWPVISVSASASVLPHKYSGLISFRMDWFDLAVQGTLKSLLQHHSSKTSIL